MQDPAVQEPVSAEVPAVATEKKARKVKEPKVPQTPKATRFGKGWTAEKWEAHMKAVSLPAIPEGYIGMSKVCKDMNAAGVKTSRVVAACGGDRAGDGEWGECFKVVYVGGRKYLPPEVMTTGLALLQDPAFHAGKKGRVAKPKAEGEATAPKKIKIKAAPQGEPAPWVAPDEPK